MVPPMQRRITMIVAVLLLATLATSCVKARAGTRCRSTDWGDGGSHVLRCINGRWKAVMTRQQAIDAVVALANAAKRPPVGDVVAPSTLGAPNLANLADPSVLVEDGITYVYGTSNYRRVPVVRLDQPDGTAGNSAAVEAMGTKPAWAMTTEIWAPTVRKLGGRFVMFFAAHRAGAPNPNSDQCIGRAFANSPTGPFSPDPTPVTCGADGVSGALDPSLFVGPDGEPTLLVAMGGSSTNIFSISLDHNAEVDGPITALLTREQPWQDWFLENPAMIWDGQHYVLAYSAGRWDSANYMTGVAQCATPAGPCTDRPAGPWLTSIGDRVGPGGLEFFVGPDGQARVAFHTYPANNVTPVGARSTHIRKLFTDPWPRLG